MEMKFSSKQGNNLGECNQLVCNGPSDSSTVSESGSHFSSTVLGMFFQMCIMYLNSHLDFSTIMRFIL